MKYYVVDVFADKLFKGNTAGVCLLDKQLDASIMLKIAFENNLSETAFLFENDGYYELRWFTPEVEIDLCGHATLASAFIIMNYIDNQLTKVDFKTMSGPLSVIRDGNNFIMDFPSRKPVSCAQSDILEKALGIKVVETHKSRDLVVLLENETAVRELKPDFQLLKKIDAFGIIVTAKGNECDFVSRFFAPNAGILEDPATGSSHCTLIPFWSEKLNKKLMYSKQLSKRGGEFICENCGDRVKIGGKAVLYLEADIQL